MKRTLDSTSRTSSSSHIETEGKAQADLQECRLARDGDHKSINNSNRIMSSKSIHSP